MTKIKEPHAIITHNGTTFTLLGTVHVSDISAKAVTKAINTGKYDAVAIELCDTRAKVMLGERPRPEFKWFDSFRTRGIKATFLYNAMMNFYKSFKEAHGISPGAEFHAAITLAKKKAIPYTLIDQDFEVTTKRVSDSAGIVGSMVGYLFMRLASWVIRHVPYDKLQETIAEMKSSPEKYMKKNRTHATLVVERDVYMVNELLKMTGHKNILVVIGAGHLEGMENLLKNA